MHIISRTHMYYNMTFGRPRHHQSRHNIIVWSVYTDYTHMCTRTVIASTIGVRLAYKPFYIIISYAGGGQTVDRGRKNVRIHF